MILIFRPYKAGDFIEAQGFSGTVAQIEIFNTILTTPDNKTIIIPNGKISGDSIINYSTQLTRRVDQVYGISYEDDIDLAKSIILNIVSNDKRVHSDPEPFVAVSELADSSVNIVSRAWVDSSNYWPVYFGTIEAVKKAFDAQGISIPYPQQDVHMYAPGESSNQKVVNA
jgi:small conductance mechanosensitive channel